MAKQKLNANRLAFVLVKDGTILSTGTGEGIAELLDAVSALGIAANGSSLADKIVGKAVAMVARAARVRAVYSPLASQAALTTLTADHIVFEYDRLVPLILNMHNDGPCPMERLTLSIDDPTTAVAALESFVRSAQLEANRQTASTQNMT